MGVCAGVCAQHGAQHSLDSVIHPANQIKGIAHRRTHTLLPVDLLLVLVLRLLELILELKLLARV